MPWNVCSFVRTIGRRFHERVKARSTGFGGGSGCSFCLKVKLPTYPVPASCFDVQHNTIVNRLTRRDSSACSIPV